MLSEYNYHHEKVTLWTLGDDLTHTHLGNDSTMFPSRRGRKRETADKFLVASVDLSPECVIDTKNVFALYLKHTDSDWSVLCLSVAV